MKTVFTIITALVLGFTINFVINNQEANAAPEPAPEANNGNAGNNAGNNGNNGNAGNNGNNGNSENTPKGKGHNE